MIKINKLEIENTKRVRAVSLEPSANGLTIIGGNNQQGKTSVLDAICWALGGNKYKPSNAQREGSMLPPSINITLSNGLIVQRKGKNSDLKVIDPSGNKSGQRLLDSFVGQFALDLPKFLESNNKEKALVLLRLLGIGDKLVTLDRSEKELYNRRHTIGQITDQKKKYVAEMQYYPDAPAEPVSAFELIQQQQAILAKNGENQQKRLKLEQLESELNSYNQRISTKQEQLKELQQEISQLEAWADMSRTDIETARKTVSQLQDQSTKELEEQLSNIEIINNKVRINKDRERANDEYEQYKSQYDGLTEQIDQVRKDRFELLKDANLPLSELSIQDGELIYKGKKWDCMSSTDQLIVAVAITKDLNPNCGFVLMDKLEQFDMQQLTKFGEYLKTVGLQVIATRVSTGNECSIIIEDGIGGNTEELGVYKVEKGVYF